METMEAKLHLRFEGRSSDIPLRELDMGFGNSDEEIKAVVAGFLGVDTERLNTYVVEREVSGNLTIRPEAVFG